jgi:NDP-sugar pyrophosphorylase family protein
VPIDERGRVEGFVEKPPVGEAPTNLINAGVYVLQPAVLARVPAGRAVSIEREVFPDLAREGLLSALPTDAYWMDIGTPEKYLQANLDWLAGRISVDRGADREGAIAASASIAADAQVSSACVGRRTIVEERAVVTRSVLLDDVQVGAGAQVTSSILGEGVRVAPGAIVSDRAVGDGEVIES